MEGNDRQRHCAKCDRPVYNLAEMEPEALVALIEETEGRLCGRLFRRRDGTILTKDCPEGRRRTGRIGGAVTATAGAASMAAFLGLTATMGEVAPPDEPARQERDEAPPSGPQPATKRTQIDFSHDERHKLEMEDLEFDRGMLGALIVVDDEDEDDTASEPDPSNK